MAFELIETVTLTAAASSIEFTAIPQDGVDLYAVCSLRTAYAAGISQAILRINGDAANYSGRQLRGTGSAASSTTSSDNGIRVDAVTGDSQTANTFGSIGILYSNYTSTTNKSISTDGVSEANETAAFASIGAGGYATSSPITSLQFFVGSFSGDNIKAGSTVSLYKIS